MHIIELIKQFNHIKKGMHNLRGDPSKKRIYS